VSRSIFTKNTYHLGDNLIFLHLLRALAKQHDQTPFVHFCNGCDIHQLREVAADLPNIILADFESPLWQERGGEAIDTWKNHDHFWENSRFRWDWSQFMLSHHDWTAARMRFVSPFKVREHLLFDYPALQMKGSMLHGYEFLIGNSEPCSGQFGPMKVHGSRLIENFANQLKAHEQGACMYTDSCRNSGDSISDIGKFSLWCKHHVMVATGPFWPTLNVHNHHNHEGRRRIVLLDNGENLNMPHIIQMSSVDQVMRFAKEEGWI